MFTERELGLIDGMTLAAQIARRTQQDALADHLAWCALSYKLHRELEQPAQHEQLALPL